MELPTYTNIWKIEKRLYKLYDFRLPMPLPVGQVAVFVAIAVPYMLILTMAGMPFSHTWVWLYVLPPGVLAWLVTRPVLESKRLPELVLSQLRYLSEPRTWCRMAPRAEKDEITVVARVWRRTATSAPSVPTWRAEGATKSAPTVNTGQASGARPATVAAETVVAETVEAEAAAEATGARPATVVAETVVAETVEAEAAAEATAAEDPTDVPGRPVWPSSPAIHAPAAGVPASAAPAVVPAADVSAPAASAPAASAAQAAGRVAASAPGGTGSVGATPGVAQPATSAEVPIRGTVAARMPAVSERAASEPGAARPFVPERPAPKPPWRPNARARLTVRTDGRTSQPLHLVERALRSSPEGGPSSGWNDRVIVVPGGHRPGKPDQVQRDQARARLPLAGPARIVVLGCTAGAGQTVTTLLTGHLLAGLRGEEVAVLDLCAGPGSLTEQARQIPRLLPGGRTTADGEEPRPSRKRGLQVVTADNDADEPADAGTLIDAVVARYPLTLADPAAAQVPRALHVADQLVLVAPASPDAAGALAMTLEWLDGHGHAELARRAVVVLNGVSANSGAHTDKAAAVASGWCRAIVRVPWDDRLSGHGPLGAGAVQAYTALAGVLVSGLAGVAAQSGSASQ